jgi:hypothetical protein
MAENRDWPGPCSFTGMLKKIARLFVIKTRFEACLVIYALGLGACERGLHYLASYPGSGGWLLFAACTGAVFMAGARLMEVTRKDNLHRRRKSDYFQANERQSLGNSAN